MWNFEPPTCGYPASARNERVSSTVETAQTTSVVRSRFRSRLRRTRSPSTAPRTASPAARGRDGLQRQGLLEAGSELEKPFDAVDLKGSAEQEALAEVALLTLEATQLVRLLDPLPERLEPERLAKLDQALDDRCGFARGGDPSDERAVDLDRVEREGAEVGERAVAGAEVVDRDPHPHLLEGGKPCGGPLGV